MAASSAQPATLLPIVISEWRRNADEIIRVSLNQFNGRDVIDVRSWWKHQDGLWRPSRSGITLAVQHLTKLSEAMQDALTRARALGLVREEGRGDP